MTYSFDVGEMIGAGLPAILICGAHAVHPLKAPHVAADLRERKVSALHRIHGDDKPITVVELKLNRGRAR